MFEDLCNVLDISVNELLAGENISTSDLNVKANKNIIDFAKDSKRKETYLKRIIVIVTVFTMILASFIGYGKYKELSSRNTISKLDYSSSKVQAVELLLGHGTAYIYDFEVENFKRLFLHVSIYKNGELVDNSSTGLAAKDSNSANSGELLIGIDYNNYLAKIAYNVEGTTIKKEIPLIEDENDKTMYGFLTSSLSETTKITNNKEIPVLSLIYDKDEMRNVDLNKPIENQMDALSYDEYVYIFSIEFKN